MASKFLIFLIFSELFCVSFCYYYPICPPELPEEGIPIYKEDIDRMQFAENIEFFEAEYFSWSTYGYGLDVLAPQFVKGGPPPIGGQRANLDLLTHKIIKEFSNQEIGHIRALVTTVGGIPRPLIDLRAEVFAKMIDEAFGHKLEPPFNPYRDSLSYMISCYILPYVGMTAYDGTNPFIKGYVIKRLLAGLLAAEAGQDAIVRTYLYERAEEVVYPYNYTVADFTIEISNLRNRLGMCGIKDEGLFVPPELGAENRTESNVLSLNYNSLGYARSAREVLRIMYNTGNEHVPGGFYPEGANGKIARQFLKEP